MTKVLYLTTNYPWMSHTFIQREILEVERRGWDVYPMALNPPKEGELLSDLDHRESLRTFYVKAVRRGEILRTVAWSVVRHPRAWRRGLARAARTSRGDLRLAGKHVFQLVEAVLVWRHGETIGVRAVHAHFGQAPATVAWFASEFGNDVTPGSWTWSATIHGWHEFVSEEASLLAPKVASADFIACISDFTRSQLMRIAGSTSWAKLHVVRCGLDLDEFAFRPAPAPSDPPVLVTTARLSSEKGHSVLLHSLALLDSRGFQVDARLVGDGPMRDELAVLADELGVSDRVQFLGAVAPADVVETLRTADVFCLPSFAEGLPVSIMEAMSIGVPVVTTYISGIPELVVSGDTGWVVPAGDVERLADAIVDAIRGSTRGAVVEAARRAVAERHDIRRSGERLVELFGEYHGVDHRAQDGVGRCPSGVGGPS